MTAIVVTRAATTPNALGATIARYAALGDSFTVGRWLDGGRWTDSLASQLARANPELAHWNLAEPGATSADVLQVQLPRALELEPDLVSVVCGVNDVLLTAHPDLARYAARLRRIIGLIREDAPGCIAITATCPNYASRLPLTERIIQRLSKAIELLNAATRSLASRLEVPYVDLASAHLPRSSASSGPGLFCSVRRTDPESIAAAFAKLLEVSRAV